MGNKPWHGSMSQKDSSYQYRKYVINCRPIADLRIVFQTYLITFNACLTICIHCVYDEIVPEIRIYKDATSPLFRKYLARIVVYYISYTIHYSLCLRKVLYNKTIHMFWIRKNCRFLNLFITSLWKNLRFLQGRPHQRFYTLISCKQNKPLNTLLLTCNQYTYSRNIRSRPSSEMALAAAIWLSGDLSSILLIQTNVETHEEGRPCWIICCFLNLRTQINGTELLNWLFSGC